MGAVWKARHAKLDKYFSLKILPSHISCNPAAVTRFEREMRAAGQVEHPNVIRATDAGDPIQLRSEIDESGFWSLTLAWLAGNQQLSVLPLSDSTTDPDSICRWRNWLEAVMLCNIETT